MDLEATDKYAKSYIGITEIAAILYDTDTGLEIDTFAELCYPKVKSMSPDASAVTGYTLESLAEHRAEEEVLMDFAEWVALLKQKGEIDEVVGFNIKAFDYKLITARMEEFYGIECPLRFYEQKLFDMYWRIKGVKKSGIPCLIENTGFFTPTGRVSYRQEHIAHYLGIEYDAHKAIDDVRAMIEIYKKLFTEDTVKKKTRAIFGF